MTLPLTFKSIIENIKNTASDVCIFDQTAIQSIINQIDVTPLTKDNIYCLLKLIANISINETNRLNNDIDYYITFIETNNLWTDGAVISLINICCSPMFNNVDKAIALIDKNNVHKTSSYIPVFKYLAKCGFREYDKLKFFFNKFVDQNKQTNTYNKTIKKENQIVKAYNEQIRFMHQKLDNMKELNMNLVHFVHPDNQYRNIDKLLNDVDNLTYEIQINSEKELIEIPDNILSMIIECATNNNDIQFVFSIIPYIKNSQILAPFFDKFALDIQQSENHNRICHNCNHHLNQKIIDQNDIQDILSYINTKVMTMQHRDDTNQSLNDKEINLIRSKWNEFITILNDHDFDVIIDGANLGRLTSHNNSIDPHIIRETLNNIVMNTRKKILFVIHEQHIKQIKQLNLSQEVAKHVVIFFTPRNINDDLFWLYATLYKQCFILTNDQCRDHANMVAYQSEIKQWEKYYKINVDPFSRRINEKIYMDKQLFIPPGIYINDNKIHIINQDMKSCQCITIRLS